MAILSVRDLVVKFHSIDGTVHAINGVSFDLYEGETLAVVGESGSGKSVTMMSIVGLIPQPPGAIEGGTAVLALKDGSSVDLLAMDEKALGDIRGAEIGFIFQDPISSLNPVMTIGDQIAESILRHKDTTKTEARVRAIELLNDVGIADPDSRYDGYPHEFSGGMRQRVMIAIALAAGPGPRIIIADEPTTALDVTVQAQIVDVMQELQAAIGAAVIWVSHDLGVVAGIADRVLVMYGGTIVEQAPVDDLYERPLHPYTLGLLKAIPSVTHAGERLVSIDGTPPGLTEPLELCPFADRCGFVIDRCVEERPALAEIRPGHLAACFVDVTTGEERTEHPSVSVTIGAPA